jgi:hypothetical protein
MNFKSLLDRSPFSLPTAEETASPADRFFLTGVATINEKPVVFVFDKNTQNRLMLEKMEGSENQSRDKLFEVFQSPDPKNLRASVQIEGSQIEIRFAESSFTDQSPAQPPQPPVLPPAKGGGPPQPASQPSIQPANNAPSQTPPRRVIRRRVISGEPPAQQPIPGQ